METLDKESHYETPEPISNGRPTPIEIEDIDPRQWLTSDDSAVVGFINTRAGRLKIAALNETETDRIRKASERPINPGKANSGKKVELKMLRCLTACESLNKANKNRVGYIPIMPNELEIKLAGEITMMVNAIYKLSGYKEEEEENLENFLHIS